jgi:hypothetical protein
MTSVAKEAGVQRETLYRSLSETGNPTLTTFESVLSVCGVEIVFRAAGTATVHRASSITQNDESGSYTEPKEQILEKCLDALLLQPSYLTQVSKTQPLQPSALHWTPNTGDLYGNDNPIN